MKPLSLLLLISSLSGCSAITTGLAEVTGLSFFHDRRTSNMLLQDERIEINAALELNSHKDTRTECHFNVTAYNGTVLVTGEAPTEQLRNKVISIVRTIKGVKLVHNELKVTKLSSFSSRSHDALITTKIKSSLSGIKNLPGFDSTRVKVITENGVVYLLGLVHEHEANVATEVARRETGVKQVVKIFELIEYKAK
jgi:osmotically-inducible protein OsmY